MSLTALLSVLIPGVFAVPPFKGPTIESYRQLSITEHREYRRQTQKLLDPNYMQVRIQGTDEPRYFGPSYYFAPTGSAELQTLATRLLNSARGHDAIVFVGRSGAGVKAYLEGVLERAGRKENGPKLIELPFSCSDPYFLTAAQKMALRTHLEGEGLSPLALASRERPVLFMDFVYTGTGVSTLIKQLHDWAREQGVARERLKSRLGFFGAYPARMLVVNNLMKLNHDSIREGSPIAITEERIADEVRGRRLPNYWTMHDLTASVGEMQISDTLYDYAGNLVRHPNASFTPERWSAPVGALESVPSFSGHSGELPYVERYALIAKGYAESLTLLDRISCEKLLLASTKQTAK